MKLTEISQCRSVLAMGFLGRANQVLSFALTVAFILLPMIAFTGLILPREAVVDVAFHDAYL